MGRSKALLPTDRAGETFLSRLTAALLAGGLDDVVLVLADPPAEEREALERVVAGLPAGVRPVLNPDPSRGQLSSLQTGLAVVDRPGVSAMLVALIDAPNVSPATVRALLAAYRDTHAPIVRPVRAGRHGHPVIFDRTLFDPLRQADPALGARAVVRARAARAIDVVIEDEGAFQDIDTPADYQRAFGRAAPGGGVAESS